MNWPCVVGVLRSDGACGLGFISATEKHLQVVSTASNDAKTRAIELQMETPENGSTRQAIEQAV